jgi:hypothetical protein
MSELMLPLRIWSDYKISPKESAMRYWFISRVGRRYRDDNKEFYPFKINVKRKWVYVSVMTATYIGSYCEELGYEPIKFGIDHLVNRIPKKYFHKWDLERFKKRKYSYFLVKEFVHNEIGFFAVIESKVENEIINYYYERQKKIFREHIWCEMIQRVMRPKRLVKMAGLYDLGLMDYMDLMGF